MKVVDQIKKISKKILIRAKHDDLLYLFLELAGGSLILVAPPLGALAIFIKVFQGKNKLYTEGQLRNSFYYFRKNGLVSIQSDRGNVTVALTAEGIKRARFLGAGKILSNRLKEKTRWDEKWRIVMFDLDNRKTNQRNSIRFFLKRCGFILMQKSVWIYPHDCLKEVNFIRSFFRLTEKEFRFIKCDNIGEDSEFKKVFGL